MFANHYVKGVNEMNEIWANRLIAGTKTWAEMPAQRWEAVKAILSAMADEGKIPAEAYQEITGEEL